MARFRFTSVAFGLTLVAAMLFASVWRAPVADVALASSLERFADCDAFLGHVRDEALDRVGPWGLSGGGFGHGEEVALRADAAAAAGGSAGGDMAVEAPAADMAVPEAAPMAPPLPMADEAGDAVREVSGTNVQERGVDEPDIVKTDGRVLAAVARGRLQLVDVSGDEPRLAADVELPHGWGHELLLHQGRLLVTSMGEDAVPGPGMERVAGAAGDLAILPMGSPRTVLTLLDVTDPDDPETLGTLKLDGQAVSSRLVDGMVRLVLRSQRQPALATPQPSEPVTEEDLARLAREAEARNREIVASSRAEDWLPGFTRLDADGDIVEQAPVTSCGDVRHPAEFSGFGMITVLALAMQEEELRPTGSATVLGDGDTVYATPDRLYVAMHRWERLDVAAPGPGVDRVDPAVAPDAPVSDTMPAPEPMPPGPAPAPMPPVSQRTFTEIHEFDTSDPARPRYTASGEVDGHLLNQWSLSAHDGHLRVATTEEEWDDRGPRTESGVHVLRREGARLVEVGSVGGLGKGERIYAVRYFGPIGFVVTFRQVDPLYTLDLSDPEDPEVVGELKIPGYSGYLHPVGDGLLLGVGQDADTETGRTRGVQLSLFDVSDLADPRRVAQLGLEPDSHTEVEHEHRAFLWWPALRRAFLPYQRVTWDERTQNEQGFSGAVAVDVGEDGLREAGRITHVEPGEDFWFGQIRRAVVVGDTLYTISEQGVLASGVEDLEPRAEVGFRGPEPGQVEPGLPEPEPLMIE